MTYPLTYVSRMLETITRPQGAGCVAGGCDVVIHRAHWEPGQEDPASYWVTHYGTRIFEFTDHAPIRVCPGAYSATDQRIISSILVWMGWVDVRCRRRKGTLWLEHLNGAGSFE